MMQKISKADLAARLERACGVCGWRYERAEHPPVRMEEIPEIRSQVPACVGGARLAVHHGGDGSERVCRLRSDVKVSAMRLARRKSCASRKKSSNFALDLRDKIMSFLGRLSFPSQSRKLKKEGLSSHACKPKSLTIFPM